MREFMKIVEAAHYPVTASGNDVAEMVQRLHARDEDFYEGNLLNRISKYHTYVLKMLPISSLNLEEWSYDDDTVDAYASRVELGEEPPPIVYDGIAKSIIDGMHRARAIAQSGKSTILAYVGVRGNRDRTWRPE